MRGGSRWNQFAKYWSQAGHSVTVLAGTVHYATGKKEPQYKGKFVVREPEMKNVDVLRCHVSKSNQLSNPFRIPQCLVYISFYNSISFNLNNRALVSILDTITSDSQRKL